MLIGRDRELFELEATLDRGEPALVLLAAPPGLGKTVLLKELSARAKSRGWAVAEGEEGARLCVSPATGEEQFSDLVRKVLGRQPVDARPGGPRAVPLAEELSRRAPVLVLIDGFRATERFARWFGSWFEQEVKSAGAPIVIVAAGQTSELASLVAYAAQRTELGPLDAAAVEGYLRSLASQVHPPIGPKELEVYVREGRHEPGILDNLGRLLALACSEERS